MTQKKKDALIFSCLLLAFAATILWGYATGDFQKLFHKRTPEERAAAEQRALDHILGSDQAFDPAADNVTTTAESKSDTVTWKTLSQAKFKEGKNAEVDFSEDVRKLNGHDITITGYIFPLEASGDQRHFLLSAYPPSCPYCLPGGATELIEVTDSEPIKFTYDTITIHGKFELLSGDALKEGMFYRMSHVFL